MYVVEKGVRLIIQIIAMKNSFYNLEIFLEKMWNVVMRHLLVKNQFISL